MKEYISETAELYTALFAHEIGVGDEVITAPFKFISTPNSILFTDTRPAFADIDEETFDHNLIDINKEVELS